MVFFIQLFLIKIFYLFLSFYYGFVIFLVLNKGFL